MFEEKKDFDVIYMEDTDKRFVSRQKVYMLIEGNQLDETMSKHNNHFVMSNRIARYRDKRNDDITINFDDIKEIHIDLQSFYSNFGIFSQFVFYPKVDMITDEGTYKFLAKNKDDFIDVINYFHTLNIPVEDPRLIEDAYHQFPKDYERCKFYQRTHKDLTKYGAYSTPDLYKEFKENKKKK